MSNLVNKNLKIEFRAVPICGSTYHVLEYRISPNQENLTYETKHSFLGIKYKKTRKYDIEWKRVSWFMNYSFSYRYDDEYFNSAPIFIHDKDELKQYKEKFKTIGEFMEYVDRHNAEQKYEWRIARDKFLEEKQVIWE